MNRRRFLQVSGLTGVIGGTAGCIGDSPGDISLLVGAVNHTNTQLQATVGNPNSALTSVPMSIEPEQKRHIGTLINALKINSYYFAVNVEALNISSADTVPIDTDAIYDLSEVSPDDGPAATIELLGHIHGPRDVTYEKRIYAGSNTTPPIKTETIHPNR